MPNTTNYSFPTPADTDLVKNGADAIRDLGDAVDTAMNTALGTKKAGMVLLNTTSFSAVASQSVNDVFSAIYNNYKIVINLTGSTASTDLAFRLRVSGSDNTTSGNYRWAGLYVGSDASTVFGQNSGTGSDLFRIGGTGTGLANFDFNVYSPFISQQTGFNSSAATLGSSSVNYTDFRGGSMTVTTSYTGFTILPTSASNLTGTIRIFGVNQ
jgi:hypothetical protein